MFWKWLFTLAASMNVDKNIKYDSSPCLWKVKSKIYRVLIIVKRIFTMLLEKNEWFSTETQKLLEWYHLIKFYGQ